MQYHPDKNNSEMAIEKFKKISEAYQALTNKSNPIGHMPDYKFVDPRALFAQLFQNNLNRSNIFNMGQQVFINPQTCPSSANINYTSTTVHFINGKKIETVIQKINGVTRKQTKISNIDDYNTLS